MKIKWMTTALLAASLILPSVVDAAGTAYYKFTWDNEGQSTGGAFFKDGTTFVAATIAESAGMSLSWDQAHQRAEMKGYGRKAAVRIGNKVGIIEGKLVRMNAAPFLYKNELYLPTGFVVQMLEGGALAWDPAQHLVSASGLHTYAGSSQTYEGRTYSVANSTGDLYVTDKSGARLKLANLGSKLYETADMSFQKTPAGLLLLTIHDNYGEPHINNHIFTLVLKGDSVIRQNDVHYWKRYKENVVLNGNELLLTDGKKLRIIEDGTGKVKETLDLVKLGGEDSEYFIEGAGDDFLLIRPNDSGLLTLVDRKSGESVKLYDKLLSKEEIEYAQMNDVPYKGDWLEYVKREGKTLYFKNNSMLSQDKKVYTYTLPMKGDGQ
ncbi:hypothetical protein GRF59_10755 [Paenibacillus sp. HJL G12]|uniref:Copper amine oxidase-like N-terminal domain-containing protein n=1 Tax=Paenibacillus dendrobii TaxID=2691084 RepID=A0A7X3III8_9BACL|nr:copper amine oxidase N-terminal domain-containing protein [Paenibacillus dendrobii]MWV44111.1 hypothetical protein [Paenibacillus dendrobii]